MNWTSDQRKIIDARNCNLLVSAAAGSGKTAVLVERIIQMISDKNAPVDIDKLLVVTFTKAAAGQMKDKIAKAMEQILEKEPDNEHYLKQMNYINKANILTIDSFCYQVVREHFYVLGIDPGIRIGDTGEIGLLREDILEKVMEEFYKENKDFIRFSDAFSADKNDEGIEDYILKIYSICSSYPRPEEWTKQARASLHIESEEAFLELAFVKQYFHEVHGTAKGIRDKILNALEQVRSTDGPLYMEKALLSDIQFVDDLISAGTYSQFFGFSNVKFANIGRGKKGEFNEEVAERIKKQREDYKKQVKNLLAAFSIPFETLLQQMQEQEPMFTALLDAVDVFRKRFLQAKLDKNLLEFSDVEHFALRVLCQGYDEEGKPVPSEIGKEMSENFAEILIDEYQDSNYLQEAILSCVSTVYQGKNNIFMVGDVKQSIYSFRMARPDLFMEKYHTYHTEEDKDARKLLLKNNFRSRANVLEGINYIFYQIMGSDLGGIDYTEDEALVPGKTFPEGADDSVELLIGESKDFDFLNADDEAMTGEKEENLDEDLEDIGKMELEAAMAAKRIGELMGENGNKSFEVEDAKTGRLRKIDYRDIVILFRAPSSFQQIFSEVLTEHGIPVKVQNENGYFDTVEIRLILSLLWVLDNPCNDVELAAVLRSFFGEFNSDELALLALTKRQMEQEKKEKLPLFSVVKTLAELCDEKSDRYSTICRKCNSIFGQIETLKSIQAYHTTGELLTYIYYNTGYYYYVKAMPDGEERSRNLDLFLGEARRFENGTFQSVFDFLLYVDKLQKKSISLGGDPALESNENVVRIMSIHKSKGLEFPVVFLAGTGKNFNLMDTKAPLIIHSDYFLGAKYRNPEKRCGNDTFVHKAMASLMITQSIAEELRIFYVGLTRAKEKLILTGVTSDMPALVKRYEEIAKRKDVGLSYSIVHTARNYLDFIVAALIRNDTFYKAMKTVRKRIDQKSGNIISAEYEKPVVLKKPQVSFKVEVYDFRNLVIHHIQSRLERKIDQNEWIERWESSPEKNKEKLDRNLKWEYPNRILSIQKSKLSVTEIKRIYETDYEPSDVVEYEAKMREKYVPPIPHFLTGSGRPMDAAKKGTWMHKTMELLNHAEVETKAQVSEALETMRKSGRIPEETRTFITDEKVYAMVNSSLGKRMRKAAKKGLLFKEKQFVTGVLVEQILKEKKGMEKGQQVIVQGIIDAYFQEGDNLILLDYKTDHIKAGQEELLVKRYQTQLLYYKNTLEQLTGLTVSETYLYSFSLDKEICMFLKK